MFRESVRILKSHYGYFMGVFILTILGSAIVNQLLNQLAPANPFFEQLAWSAGSIEFDSQAIGELSKQGMLHEFWGIRGVVNLIAFLVSTFLSLLAKRAVLQKINFPTMRVADSAFFHTSPLSIVTLPLKSILANFIGTFLVVTLFILAPMILFQMGQPSFMVSVFLGLVFFAIFIVIATYLLPIDYLIAYDVEGKYSFWSTFTKAVSIVNRHFGRIFKTMIVIFFLSILTIGLFVALIGFLVIDQGLIVLAGLIGLVVVLICLFWLVPLFNVYLAKTFNQIFEVNY